MTRPRRILGIVVVLALIGAGMAIVASSLSEGVFSLTADEAIEGRHAILNREVRISGRVAPGSIKRGSGGVLEFQLAGETSLGKLGCVYQGIVPDPFAEGRDVILDGVLQDDELFHARHITVKCPSKYQEQGPAEKQAVTP